ncbi:MAG: beta-lactamase family protein [Halioglobus sp.]|nr:beta-lactamase family protein [Halioglobus sp.]
MPKLTPAKVVFTLSMLGVLAACSDSNNSASYTLPPPNYDFTAIDTAMQTFIDDSETFDGISYTLVDRTAGAVHEAAFGDHTVDTIVMLASTSKVPSVTLLMALNDDDSLNFSVDDTIDTYLPWNGVYGDRTVTQLVSNTSGIPGLDGLDVYGAHICQFNFDIDLEICAETLYSVEVPGTVAPNTQFRYGGTPWQISGAVAQQVTNSTWNQVFDEYIGQPCNLDVFTYGNPWLDIEAFNGSPDSLIGQQNAHVEGGAITSLSDYAKILLLHLRDGVCGDTQVVSAASLAYMRENRAGPLGTDYGMGWWIALGDQDSATLYFDPGAFGAISWMDLERGIGGYVAIDDYSRRDPNAVRDLVLGTVIPLQQALVDDARGSM